MANPLDGYDQQGINHTRGMVAVETRTITRKDGTSYSFTRTEREWIYDYCDALNRSMGEDARRRRLRYIVRGGSIELITDRPPPIPPLSWEVERNEDWLNGNGEQQSALRSLGLKLGALEADSSGRVRYVGALAPAGSQAA